MTIREARMQSLQRSNKRPKPDLPETFIIVLISTALTVFVFWISSRSIGENNFSQLPGWITGTYKGIFVSATTGVAGIGLAIVKAFRSGSKTHPDYFKYVGVTTSGVIALIAIIVLLGRFQSVAYGALPPGVTLIKANARNTKFQLDDAVPNSPLTITLMGSFSVEDGTLRGHLDSGKIIANNAPAPPTHMDRVTFRSCFMGSASNQVLTFPPIPKGSQSIAADFIIAPGVTLDLPPGNFSVPLPEKKLLNRSFLCAVLNLPEINSFHPVQ